MIKEYIKLFFSFILVGILSCNSQNYKEYSSVDLKFSVLMPSKPQKSSETLTDITFNQFTAKYDKVTYIVSVDEYPSYISETINVDRLLENLIAGMHSKFPDSLQASPIEYKNYPGKQFVVSCFSDFECKGKAYFIGNNFYAIFVVYEYGQSAEVGDDVDRFVDSFEYRP